MIRTISPQDMREMERAFLEGTGYPSILLMEHAAQAVVDALSVYAPGGGRVLFVCGNGNNGGDGCAAARLWMQRGEISTFPSARAVCAGDFGPKRTAPPAGSLGASCFLFAGAG